MNNETVVDQGKVNEFMKNWGLTIESFRIFYTGKGLNQYGLEKGFSQEYIDLLPTSWLEKMLYNEWLKDEERYHESN